MSAVKGGENSLIGGLIVQAFRLGVVCLVETRGLDFLGHGLRHRTRRFANDPHRVFWINLVDERRDENVRRR